ncbi:peptidyl-prolyl cis-trans isomerase [bacterium]|nr:peptidyl-prolyl cis-trans isomerase [bacterium]MBU1990312.1 peptidyl-prolyl cis-trans isomerase [bacterium]
MASITKKIAFEPLFHFLLLGLVLYIYYEMNTDVQTQQKKSLHISSYETGQLASEYKRGRDEDISPQKMEALVAKKVYETVLLNEAYSLGLDRQDAVISRRLINQMHFLMSSVVEEPSEEQLRGYYEKNINDYSLVERVSFYHVYFSDPKDEKIEDVFNLLNISEMDLSSAPYLGDKFYGAGYIENSSFEDLEKTFGKYFVLKIFNLKQGAWHRLIHSSHGAHLLYVTDKNVKGAYPFDEVEERVYEDYMNDERKTKQKESYKKIRSQYKLTVQS